jgi:hypothetical protein
MAATTVLVTADAVGAQPDLEALQKTIEQRDMLILDLQRRVDALEKALHPREETSTVSAAATRQPQPAGALADEETTRALERALTREGGLVLPSGTYELEPRVEYTHRGRSGLAIVDVAGQPQVAQQVERQGRIDASLGMRIGLPRNFQGELRLPYSQVRVTGATAGALRETRNQSGLGDVEVGLTKQLWTEEQARFGLLGSVRWRIPSGQFRLDAPSPGSGFHMIQGALSAVKRQDPLVFFGTLSYASVLKRSHSGLEIDPGNPLALRLGTILAATPQTSLRGAFELSRQGMTRIGGTKVPGSDAVSGALQFGVATLVTRRALLDVQFEVGITHDAPDFRIGVSLPIRFN